jgi:hypothetical protein
MKITSVQLINWSDNDERKNYDISPSKTEDTYAKNALNRVQHHSRVFIGKIQAMWETELSVCRWPWTWAETLFVGKSLGQKTGTGIYTRRVCPTSRVVCFKLQKGKTTHGRDKQHQPGNSPAQRTNVEQDNGYYYQSLYRYKGNWLLSSQYDFGFSKGKSIRRGGGK